MTMKPTLQDVAMMEVIAVETAPIHIFVLNVRVMMKEHCHLMYHVSYGTIFGIFWKIQTCTTFLCILT